MRVDTYIRLSKAKNLYKTSVVTHACNPSTQEAKAEGKLAWTT
jgi:hypothetical protein